MFIISENGRYSVNSKLRLTALLIMEILIIMELFPIRYRLMEKQNVKGEAVLRIDSFIRSCLPLMVASSMLAACSGQQVEPSSTPAPTQQILLPSPEASSNPSAAPTTGSGSRTEPLASIPEHDIFLYGEENGVALRIGDETRTFDWMYMTPTNYVPRLQVQDYDGDGKEELSVILHVGSGTGIAVDELHMIKMDPADPNYFKDQVFHDYGAQLSKAVQIKTILQNDVLFGQLSIDSASHSVNLKELQSPEFGKVSDQLHFGNIVRFEHEGKLIKAQFAAEIVVEKSVMPQSIGDIDANVSYKDGKFILSHFTFRED